MTAGEWTPLATDFWTSPKVIAAGRDAALLYLAGLTYCQHHITDGFIPTGAVPILAAQAFGVRPSVAAVLVREDLWLAADDGYEVVGWLDWNRSSEQVSVRREQKRKRQTDWREKKRRETVSRPDRDASRDAPVSTPPPPPTVENYSVEVQDARDEPVDNQFDPAPLVASTRSKPRSPDVPSRFKRGAERNAS